MRMADINKCYKRQNKRMQVRHLAVRMRALIAILGAGFLCCAAFYLGSNTGVTNLTKLKTELEEMKMMMQEMSQVKSFVKEKEKAVIKNIQKRSPNDVEVEQATTLPLKGGSTYTRWGRRDCPETDNSILVYQGIAAGSHYTHTGGGSNLLCLHSNVTYKAGSFINGVQGSSRIYGVEYRMSTSYHTLFDLSEIEEGNYRFHAVPCAICMTKGRFTQLMIPGRDECPRGWNEEYTGYIVGSAHSHKHNSDFICVDDTPHVIPGSGGDQAGELLYMVEADCPSLQCEPYVDGREVRCVVCTI